MTSRLIKPHKRDDSLLTAHTRRLVFLGAYPAWDGYPVWRGMSRTIARSVIALLTVLGLFVFIYLTEVTQVTTTAFDIEQMKSDYHQLQKLNQQLEREIAELESPEQVLLYAKSNGMVLRTDREYIFVFDEHDYAPR